MKKKLLQDQRVWLTGASTGIGEAVALELARRGARVALSARGEEKLRALAERIGAEQSLVVPCDVTDREANLRAVQRIADAWGGIDVALLNAGTCEYLDVRQWDSALIERVMATNFNGMVYGIEAALPHLRRAQQPHLVGMSSTVCIGGLPRAEAYGASKAAISYFLESLRIDLKRENIPVSSIMPGFVRTPLTDRNDFPMPMRMEPEDAARIIVNGIEREKPNIVFPWLFATIFRALALLPAGIYSSLVARGAGR